MTNDTKMLQMLIDGQKSIRGDIKKLDTKLSGKIEGNSKRIDKLGVQLAELSDDAPTRVTKLEHPQFASN